MHSTDTKSRYIELRAQGWSLARIAAHIGVAKRTLALVDWNPHSQEEIRILKALELEALHEKLLASHEAELTQLTAQLNHATVASLAGHSPSALSPRDHAASLRHIACGLKTEFGKEMVKKW